MERYKILTALCVHDKRNPDRVINPRENRPHCRCDNCLHGRHELANEILRLTKPTGIVIDHIGGVNNVHKVTCHKCNVTTETLGFYFDDDNVFENFSDPKFEDGKVVKCSVRCKVCGNRLIIR